ncbi:MAG TPA: G5 domain-containing protein [Candidatus Saccharimonadales bacterium]
MFKKVRALSTTKKVAGGLLVFAILAIVAGGLQSEPPKPVQLNARSASSSQVRGDATSTPQVTTKTVTKTESIPYQTVAHYDANLPKGQSEVTTQGAYGTETLTYKITYTNGQQTGKQLLSKTVTTLAVNQATAIGTYVAPAPASCPNGTYVNSAGNTVCSPYPAPSTPAGATAQCVDGTYSFSQSHSGTCSHHGGIATRL